MRGTITLAVVSIGLWACGGEGGTGDDAPEGFAPLVTADWSMPPGDEGYYCARVTAQEDLYIKAFRPIAPLGTHHTALAFASTPGSDGEYPCEASDTGFKLIFGSGLGTEPYALPEGVAFKVPAGEQLVLNLHLYNTGDVPIDGHSGIEIEQLAADAVVHEAETIYALGFDLSIPPGTSTHVQQCRIDGDSTVVGLFPHMHKLGTHMKASAIRAGGAPEMFFDQSYAFEQQLNFALTPLELADGDVVEYECTFANPGPGTVEFGDSTDAEMCVLGMYRYPATGAISLCLDNS